MTSFSSIFDTGISGLNSFGTQMQVVANNVANLSTVGFKVTDTRFSDAAVQQNTPLVWNGIVRARGVTLNSQQGGLTTGKENGNLAVAGNGYFSVVKPFVTINGTASVPNFANQLTQFTRKGDFSQDVNGYLVNSDGAYLQGVALANGNTNAAATGALVPIQISPTATSPAQATTAINGDLNLPAAAADGTVVPLTLSVYDANGTPQSVILNLTKQASPLNTWTLSGGAAGSSGATVTPDATNNTLTFNTDGSLAPGSGNAAASGAVSLPLTVTLADGTTQSINFNLGQAASGTDPTATGYSRGTGTTQFGGTGSSVDIRTLSADGRALGAYTGFTIDGTGVVSQNFTNGAQVPVFRVPLATFANPNGLNQVTGTLFAQVDANSGVAVRNWPNQNGAGDLRPNFLETSTADTAQQFTDLIQAQRAYSANSKTVTTADEMTQTVIGLLR